MRDSATKSALSLSRTIAGPASRDLPARSRTAALPSPALDADEAGDALTLGDPSEREAERARSLGERLAAGSPAAAHEPERGRAGNQRHEHRDRGTTRAVERV